MLWGQKYEPVSVLYYEYINKTIITEFGCIPHKDYSFIAASPDGIVCDSSSNLYGRMIEIKNVVSREITGIPKMEYWIQMQLQMEVCDLNECDFLETKFLQYDTEEEYMNDNDITIDASADGIAFVPMTNQPSAVGLLSASATTLVTTLEIAPVEDVTGISYAYAAGDVAWAAGGTSTITGKTNLSDIQTMYFGGKFHTICYENNLSAAFYETSVDEGANWVDASSEIDAGTIPTGFTSDGTTMYMTLITIATFTAYVMTTTDGTNWNTPVILAADRMASGISGKD
jgi:hypothetical protein